jgi:hypothetical protein
MGDGRGVGFAAGPEQKHIIPFGIKVIFLVNLSAQGSAAAHGSGWTYSQYLR